MSTDPLIDDEYASEDDSDFALDDAAPRDASDASDSEDDGGEQAAAATAAQPSAKRKRAAGDDGAEDDGYDNSGDEAIISKGKKKQKKRSKGKDDAPANEEDEGGEGGLVKTRSMRANEKAERRVAAASGPVTVDVDDLWARMMAGPVVPPKASVIAPADKDAQQTPAPNGEMDGTNGAAGPQEPAGKDPSGMIRIKRTYNFAGKVHTEEKVVPRDSAEAKVYLATLGEGAAEAADNQVDEDETTKRRPRRAFRSAFEPIAADGSAPRSDLNLGMAARLQMRESNQKAKKLNVVEKSRMDWAGFVDQEGIKDELELAGKSKQSYASRQDFLARVEANRDEDARRIRMAGRA
ncbi:swr complex subunit [Pestalotiopsis sp. 9143b]|nr:swr complex subunit [Pestalotiopsis sp. 9143b]